MHRHIIIFAIFLLAVSCNEEQKVVQSTQNGGDLVIGQGVGKVPPEDFGGVDGIDGDGNIGGIGDPNNPGGIVVITKPTEDPSLPNQQQVVYENVDLSKVQYSKSHVSNPGVCNSQSFNDFTDIVFRKVSSRVVVSNILEFMKAYQDEAIIILANDIDLTGLNSLPKARFQLLLIFGNNHTIKNYDSDRSLFLDTTNAYFCNLKIENVKVQPKLASPQDSASGLFKQARLHLHDVTFSNFDILIPENSTSIVNTGVGGVASSCVNNSLNEVTLKNIKIENLSTKVTSLGGLCGGLGLNFGSFEGVWDSEFSNITIDSIPGRSVGAVYGHVSGREQLTYTSSKNDVRGINIKFSNNVLKGSYAGEFAGRLSGAVDMQNINSENAVIHAKSTWKDGDGNEWSGDGCWWFIGIV